MRSNALVVILFAAGAIALVMGCAGGKKQVQAQGAAGFSAPRFEFRGIQFENPSFSGMDLAFRYELINGSDQPVKVVACPFKVEFEEAGSAEGAATFSGELAGQGRLDIQSRLAFPWPADHAGIMELLGKKQVHYTFNQSCNLEGPEGGLTVSGSDSGMVPLPRLPQMTVSGANAQRFGKDEAKLIFEISIMNENAFPVKVDKITFKITLEGKPLAEGELPVAEIIPANNETTFDIPAEIRTGDASKEIIALLNRPQLSYVLEGRVFMGSFEIPVQGDGTLTFAH